MSELHLKPLLPILLLLFAAGCDNGKGLTPGPIFDDTGTSTPTATPDPTGNPNPTPEPVPDPPSTGSFILLDSDEGEHVGDGRSFLYTNLDSNLSIEVEDGYLMIGVDGDERWTGEFELPNSFLQLEAGTYASLQRYGFHNEIFGGLSWSGDGRGCNESDGTLVIDSVTFVGDILTDIELSFEQICLESNPQMLPLRGQIRWDGSDLAVPPGPVTEVPLGLWGPDRTEFPVTGNYMNLVSSSDDFVGGGLFYLRTDAEAVFLATEEDGVVTFSVDGFENWTGSFVGMDFLEQLEPGYYPDLSRFPFHNPVKGGMDWSGDGRACNALSGWFVIENIEFDAGELASVELRFEQQCALSTTPLNGALRWTRPPG